MFTIEPFKKSILLLTMLLAAALNIPTGARATTTTLTLTPVNGNASAPEAATAELNANFTGVTTNTYAIPVKNGLMYQVQLLPKNITTPSLGLILDFDPAVTSGIMRGAVDFKWFQCVSNGFLNAVVYTDGTFTGNYTLRVLQTAKYKISGKVTNGKAGGGDAIYYYPGHYSFALPTSQMGSWTDAGFENNIYGVAISGTDGSFSIDVPAGWSGSVSSGLSDFLWQPRLFENARADAVCNFDFTPVNIAGKVTAKPDPKTGAPGAPVAGALITLINDYHYSSTTLTNADGSWNFPVPQGWTGEISVDAHVDGVKYLPEPSVLTADMFDSSEGTPSNLNFFLTPRKVKLTGKITTQLTSDILTSLTAGISVTAYGMDTTSTLPDGTYTLYVPVGWNGLVYANCLDVGNYFTSPRDISVPSVSSDTALRDFEVKKYQDLTAYYDIKLDNNKTPKSNPELFAMSSGTIMVKDTTSGNTMLSIKKKKPTSAGSGMDYPPLKFIKASSNFSSADGGFKNVYTEAEVFYSIIAARGIGSVNAKGTMLYAVETSGTLGSITVSNEMHDIYKDDKMRIIARGNNTSGRKTKIQLAGTSLEYLYAPEHAIATISTTGKKNTDKTSKASIWLPGNIVGYSNIVAKSIDNISVSEGLISCARLNAATGKINARGNFSPQNTRNGSVDIAQLDTASSNSTVGKTSISAVGGDVILGEVRTGGGISSINASPVKQRNPYSKTDKKNHTQGGNVYIERLATGLNVTKTTDAKETKKANIGGITGVNVFLGAIEAGAVFNAVKDYVQPAYLASIGKVTSGKTGWITGSFFLSNNPAADKQPVFLPKRTADQEKLIFTEKAAVNTSAP